MFPATETTKGLQLPCPCCGEPEANVKLHLADGESFTCDECENEFTATHVRDLMARWAPVLAWVEQMPQGGAS